MRKVWAASHGCYSDYAVDALFETEELAKEVVRWSGGFVEEFAIYDKVPDKIPHHHVFVVQGELGFASWGMAENQRTVHIEGGWHILEEHREDWPWDYNPTSSRPRLASTRLTDRDKGKWAFFYEGKDAEACRKAAYDKIRELQERERLLDMAKEQQRLSSGNTEMGGVG